MKLARALAGVAFLLAVLVLLIGFALLWRDSLTPALPPSAPPMVEVYRHGYGCTLYADAQGWHALACERVP